MLFFDKQQSALEKLQKHEYKDMQDKLALLEQLEQQNLPSRDIVWMLTEHDAKIRESGVKMIIGDRSQATFFLLIKELKQKEVLGRKYILPLLPRMDPEGLLPFLQKNISAPDIKDRSLAIEIISQFFRTERFIPLLLEAIRDPQPEIRYAAMVKLSSFIKKNQEVCMHMLPLLHDEVDRIRHRVIHEICQLDIAELVEPFFARLMYEPRELQDKMIAALGRISKNPELKIEERVIPELASNSDMSRDVAARILAQMPNRQEVIKKFLIYTRGIAFWLRERIFESLATVTTQIADAVIALLADEAVRIDCMFMAVYIKDRRIIPGIMEILRSDVDWWIKVCAIDILVKFKTPDLVSLLRAYENDLDLKWSVVSAYGEIADPACLPFLKQCLQDKSRYVRMETLRALARFSDPVTAALILETAEQCSDWTVRTEAIKLAEEKGLTVQAKHELIIDRNQELTELKALGFEMQENILNQTPAEDQDNREQDNTMPSEDQEAVFSRPLVQRDMETSQEAQPAKAEYSATQAQADNEQPLATKTDAATQELLGGRQIKFKFTRGLGLVKKEDNDEKNG